jgi:hypothetical protein
MDVTLARAVASMMLSEWSVRRGAYEGRGSALTAAQLSAPATTGYDAVAMPARITIANRSSPTCTWSIRNEKTDPLHAGLLDNLTARLDGDLNWFRTG